MKTQPIEGLLHWTYGEELPKLGRMAAAERDGGATSSYGSTWRRVVEIAQLGVIVDQMGGTQGLHEAPPEPPHDDALRVHDAVLGLQDAQFDMPERMDVLGDIEGLTEEEREEAHRLGLDLLTVDKPGRLAALVMRRALVGDVPPWRDHGQIVRRPVRGANGRDRWFRIVNASAGPGMPAQPREVDGFDARAGRPHRGAFRRFYLDPHPALLVAERIEYQAWVLALARLAEELAGTMTGRDVTAPWGALWPWEGEMGRRGPRLLRMPLSTGAR